MQCEYTGRHVSETQEGWLARRHRKALAWWGARFRRLPRRDEAVLGLFCDFEGHHAGPDGERYADRGTDVLMSLLERHRLRMTFNVVADLCRTHADRVRHVIDAGHEIACHGLRHRRPQDLSAAAIDEMLREAAQRFDALGVRACGFRSPQSGWSAVLLRGLAVHGYQWNAERDSAPSPYRILPKLVRVGVTTDDWDLADGTGDAAALIAKWRRRVDAARQARQVVCIGVHEWIIGRDEGYAAAFDAFLGEMSDSRIQTLGEIATGSIGA